MKRLLAYVLVVCALLGVLTGCGGGGASGEAAADGVIRMGSLTIPIGVPPDYAEDQGWFEEKGITIELSTFANGPAANEAMGSGDLDVAGIGAMPAVLGGIAYNYKVVGWYEDDDQALQIYARNDSDIVKAGKGNMPGYPELYGTPETWMGKSIIAASATSAHFTLGRVLAAMGLEESDVNLIDMEGSSGAAAFLAGEGDLYCAWDPQYNEFAANPDQYTRVATCKDAGASLICVVVANEDYCQTNEEDLVAYLEGLARAYDTFAQDEQAYCDAMYVWMNEYSDASEEEAVVSAQMRKMYTLDELQAWHEADASGNSKLADSVYAIADFMIERGLIEAGDKDLLKENGFIDTSYMLKAIENVRNG